MVTSLLAHAFPVDDSLVLFEERTGNLSLLNPTAAVMWAAYDEGLDAHSTAEKLSEVYGVPVDLALRDVRAAERQWLDARLLTDALLGPCPGPPESPPQEQEWTRAKPPTREFEAASQRTYLVLGSRFRVRCQNAALDRRVHPILAHLESAEEADAEHTLEAYLDGDQYVVACDGLEVQRDSKLDMVKSRVLAEIIVRSYPEHELRAVLHAAAVCNGESCVALPGVPGAGKSTLTAALTLGGLECLTDDCVPLCGPEYLALPFPVALSLKQGSWEVLGARYPDLSRLPTHALDEQRVRYLPPERPQPCGMAQGMPVRCVVYPLFCESAPTAVAPLPPADSLRRLFEARSWLKPPFSRQSVGEFVDWVRRMPAYELLYSDLDEGTEAVTGLLAA